MSAVDQNSARRPLETAGDAPRLPLARVPSRGRPWTSEDDQRPRAADAHRVAAAAGRASRASSDRPNE